ncbi:hypothetical protein HK097_001027 [Rhizophlyctis rosea]|uniref:BZIP domain-containing protein n=1 Tax=Rhizophlyctis rosea TaxID=64517 RepID=A0AAD5XA44_9FUNG|nr:hypothetical protein HK097_001027 [Rhizophlyctis rosea]
MPILPAVKAQGSLSPVVGLSVTSVKYTLPAPPSTVGRKRRGKDLTEVERAVKKAVREQRNREAASRSRRQRKDFQSYLENENANLLEEGCRLRKRLCTQEDVNKRLLEKIDILSQQVEGIRTLVQNAGATHGSPLSSLDRLTSISSPSDHENDTLSAPGLASSPDHASSPSVTFSPTSSPETHHLRYPVPDYTSFTDFPLFASPSTTSPTFTDDLDTLLTDILTSPSTTTDEASHPEPAAFESSLPRIQLASSPHQHSPTQKSTPSSSSPHQMQTMVFLAVAMMTARACRPEVWKVLVTAWYVCWWVVAGRVKVVLERHFRKGATEAESSHEGLGSLDSYKETLCPSLRRSEAPIDQWEFWKLASTHL